MDPLETTRHSPFWTPETGGDETRPARARDELATSGGGRRPSIQRFQHVSAFRPRCPVWPRCSVLNMKGFLKGFMLLSSFLSTHQWSNLSTSSWPGHAASSEALSSAASLTAATRWSRFATVNTVTSHAGLVVVSHAASLGSSPDRTIHGREMFSMKSMPGLTGFLAVSYTHLTLPTKLEV